MQCSESLSKVLQKNLLYRKACLRSNIPFQLEKQLKDQSSELELSRKAKEEALKEKQDLEHRHDVLRVYFNEREAELQKQLGLQSARLGDAEQGSESTCKQLLSLAEEVESYKAQVKSLKLEMEEQVGSFSTTFCLFVFPKRGEVPLTSQGHT